MIKNLSAPVVALSTLLAAGALAGFVHAEQMPGQWIPIAPAKVFAPPASGFGAYNAVGRLTAIAIDPNDPLTIYVGSAGQLGHEGCGLWKTTDGGTTWAPIADELPTLSVGAIAVDPTDSKRIYIITSDAGLFRSSDAGSSWTLLHGDLHIRSNTVQGDRVVLLVHPSSPNVLYLTSDDGVLRSTDGGVSWPVSLNAGAATSLVMDPRNPTVLYAAIAGKGIYKTVSGGAAGSTSWVQQTQAPLPFDTIRSDVATLLALSHPTALNAEVVYALVPTGGNGTPAGFELFRTNGTIWSKSYSCAASGDCFFMSMTANPADTQRVYMGGPLLWVSGDGGTTFARVPPTAADFNDRQPASPHGDYWELRVDPANSAILYAGSDGGLYRSSNHGLPGTWAFIGTGITNLEMYDLSLASAAFARAISGTQDNGTILYNGSPFWDHLPHSDANLGRVIFGGDGGGVAVDPSDPNRLYAVLDNRGTPSVSLDGGDTFVDFSAGLTASPSCAIWNMTFHMQIDPGDPQTLLASCRSLWRTMTNAPPGNWSAIFSPTGENVVRSAIDPLTGVYYAGTNTGNVFAGPAGTGWQRVFDHAEPLSVTDLDTDPRRADTLYASFAPPYILSSPSPFERNCTVNAGSARIYQLTRIAPAGLVMSAADITSNLPAGLCVNALAIDPVVPRTLYAATNHALYRGRRNATGGPWVWEAYNDGLPAADVRDLEVHAISGHLFAATFGRGAFEVALATSLDIAIDIKPGGSVNPIQPKSAGTIPVAILSSVVFNAPAEVDRTSVTFGRTGQEASLAFCNAGGEDVNGDGLPDQVCHFRTGSTGLQAGDTTGILKGLTVDGIPFTGSDSVRILK